MGGRLSTNLDAMPSGSDVAPPAGSNPLAARLFKYDGSKWVPVQAMMVPELLDERDEEEDPHKWFIVMGEFRQRVEQANRVSVDASQKRLSALFFEGEDFTVIGVTFFTDEGLADFYERYQKALFENTHGLDFTDANRTKVYSNMQSWYDCEEDMDAEWDTAEEPEPPKKQKFRQTSMGAGRKGSEAHDLRIGALANSYLLRGGEMDVYRNVDAGMEDKRQTISIAGAAGGGTPQRAIMAMGERQFVFLSPQQSQLTQFDIETGKVVTKWDAKKNTIDQNLLDIQTDDKGAQLEDMSTFMANSARQVMRWDMRTAGGSVAGQMGSPSVLTHHAGSEYKSKMDFTCLATTGDGHVAVGDATGAIRLYTDKVLTTAKTTFPGFGSPVTAIDVSYDGKWVLATTDCYVMVVCTLFKDAKGACKTGFQAQAKAHLAAPRLLRLLPQDIKATGVAKFEKARFTWIHTDKGEERFISAAVGSHTVVWSFKRFKKMAAPGSGTPDFYDYSLVKRAERVADSGFVRDRLVVATKGGEVVSLEGIDDEEDEEGRD